MTKNAAPSKKPNSSLSPTEIVNLRTSGRYDPMFIGVFPHLFNKDRTRYGGLTIIPDHLLGIEDDDERDASIYEYEKIMLAKPLTDDEKWQKDEWLKLAAIPGPSEFLDDDFADAVIACAEGRGKFPSRK